MTDAAATVVEAARCSPAAVRIDDALGAVRWLFSLAANADRRTADRAAELLVDALLDLQAYRQGDHDPRRQRAMRLARRVRRAREAGVSIPQLAERFDRSRATIHRLLCLVRSRDPSVIS